MITGTLWSGTLERRGYGGHPPPASGSGLWRRARGARTERAGARPRSGGGRRGTARGPEPHRGRPRRGRAGPVGGQGPELSSPPTWPMSASPCCRRPGSRAPACSCVRGWITAPRRSWPRWCWPIGRRLLPGEACYAQFRFEEQVLVYPGDSFIVRSMTPVTTSAGGRVIDPAPAQARHRAALARPPGAAGGGSVGRRRGAACCKKRSRRA